MIPRETLRLCSRERMHSVSQLQVADSGIQAVISQFQGEAPATVDTSKAPCPRIRAHCTRGQTSPLGTNCMRCLLWQMNTSDIRQTAHPSACHHRLLSEYRFSKVFPILLRAFSADVEFLPG